MSRPSPSPVLMRSSALSSTPTTSGGTLWRARCDASWRPKIVFPVPLRPTMSVERPSGMPPCVRMSNPGMPVVSFAIPMRRLYSVKLEQLDQRLGLREITEYPHRWLRRTLAQRRREGNLIAIARRRVLRQIADRQVDVRGLVLAQETLGVDHRANGCGRCGADVEHQLYALTSGNRQGGKRKDYTHHKKDTNTTARSSAVAVSIGSHAYDYITILNGAPSSGSTLSRTTSRQPGATRNSAAPASSSTPIVDRVGRCRHAAAVEIIRGRISRDPVPARAARRARRRRRPL